MSEQPEVPDKLNQDSSLAEPLDEAAKLKSNVQSTGDLPAPENNSVLAGATAEASPSKDAPTAEDKEKDKENHKKNLLANLMGGSSGSNPALAGLMTGSPMMGGMGGMGGFGQPQQNPNMPYTEHNVTGRPQYQMAPLGALMNPLADNAGPKHVLSHNADILKEEMIGYVNAIIERMDKAHALKKFETFQVETASRKAFGSLTEHFQTQDKKHSDATAKIQTLFDQTKKKTEMQEMLIKKLQLTVQEISVLNKKVQTLEQRSEASSTNIVKRFDQVNEKMTNQKMHLESKIDATMVLEDKFQQNKEDLKQVQDVMLKTKVELMQMTADVKIDMQNQMLKIDAQEGRMDQVLNDSKYWLERYTKAYKENDQMIARLQSEFNGRIETVFYQLSRRVTNDDIKKNFDKYNEMLEIKFRQVEDTKTAVRDLLTYQKYFYPLQMQQMVGETMMNLEAAIKDQPFMQFQQRKNDDLLAELEMNLKKSQAAQDVDLNNHLNELSKKELKTTGWQTQPLDNVEHDFVSPLLNSYLVDLEKRKKDLDDPDTGFAKQMRKGIDLSAAEDLINLQFAKISNLKVEADNKEKDLETARLKAEHEKKVSKTIRQKIEFKKQKVFKRQNSYNPQLDEFGDIDDNDACKIGLKKLRLSIDPVKNRAKLNPIVRDVTWYRLEKDILAASETQGSVMESGAFGNTGRGKRSGGNFNMQPSISMPMISGGQQLILDAPPGSNQGDIITTPEGVQCLVLPGSKTMSPLPTRPGSRNRPGSASRPGSRQDVAQMDPAQMNQMMQQMMGNQSAGLDPVARRKLIKDVRDEIKPLIAQIADFQIEKANNVIKVQIRKLENEMTIEDQRLHDKVDREIKATQTKAVNELRHVEKEIKESIRSFQRQRARDKSDIDMKFYKQVDDIANHNSQLQEHAVNFEALAIVNSMLIENINMQMEAEIADLLDRRMMSLFGVNPTKVDKIDVQNTSKKLKDVKAGRSPSPVADRQHLNQNNFTLPSMETRRGSAAVTIGASQATIDSSAILDQNDDEKQNIKEEFAHAKKLLDETHKLPISIDNKCLMSMQPGRDTSIVLRLFKTACLSYAPNDFIYREHKMTRGQMINMRRELVEKVTEFMQSTGLHKEGAIYPRRYFDDLIMEHEMAAQQSHRQNLTVTQSLEENRLKELLQPKLPFGLPSGKGSFQMGQGLMNNQSMTNDSSSPRHLDETGIGSMSARPSQFLQVKKKRNFMPAGVTLDTDSEMDVSKIHLRTKLAVGSTTRNSRNKTIDVPYMTPDLRTTNKSNHFSNLTKAQSARKTGAKKLSLQHNAYNQDTPGGSKPTLRVDHSEAVLSGIKGDHNLSLPKINSREY